MALFGDPVAPYGLGGLVAGRPVPPPVPEPTPLALAPPPAAPTVASTTPASVGLFDHIPDAPPTTGLFDGIPDAPPAYEPPVNLPGAVTAGPQGESWTDSTGLFDGIPDAPPPPAPMAGIDPMTGQPVQNLTQTPVSLGERFDVNRQAVWDSTLAGAGMNLAEATLANQAGGDYQAAVANQAADRRARYENLPPWYETPGIIPKALAGGAALTGALAGGLGSPESLVAGPEGYGAVRAGEALLPALARSAGVQAGVQGAANVGAQGMNVAAGAQQEFEPAQVAEAAGMGAAFGAAGPVAGKIVNKVAGGPKVPEIAPQAVDRYIAGREVERAKDSTGLFDHIPDEPALEPTAASEQTAPPAAAAAFEGSAPQSSPGVAPVKETPPAAAGPHAEERVGPAPELGPTEAVSSDYEYPLKPTEPALQQRAPEAPFSPHDETPSSVAAAVQQREHLALWQQQWDRGLAAPLSEQAVADAAYVKTGGVGPAHPGTEGATAPLARASEEVFASQPVSAREPAVVESKPLPPGTTATAPRPTEAPDRSFNKGTTVYHQVFRDAGLDPALAVNRPIQEQNRVIREQLKAKFGFRDVETYAQQEPKEARDQLANFYNGAQEMAAALNMPHSAISLNGRLKLTTKPHYQPDQALGTYHPGSRTITVAGRANSFAHEWTHAVDHYLAEELAKNPKAKKLLSRTKGMQDDPTRLAGKPVTPGSSPEAFAGVLRAIYGKDAATAAEVLKAQMDARHPDPAISAPAKTRLVQIESRFSKDARAAGKYWADPAEMLARAHDAYIADAIKMQGGDTASVALSDSDHPLFPQGPDRMRVFQAFNDLHAALQRESVLGTGSGARPPTYDAIDPIEWDKWTGPQKPGGPFSILRREALANKNWREQFWERAGYDKKGADPGMLTRGVRAKDALLNLFAAQREVGNAIIKRQTSSVAKANFQKIMDRLSPAEHVHTAALAQGREVGQVYEEAAREWSKRNLGRMVNILEMHDLGKMTDKEGLMLRHLMTEGRDDDYIPDGAAGPIYFPDNFHAAAKALRFLLNEEWERIKAAGIPIGYARSGFFPRIYDDLKIMSDRAGFEADAVKLHNIIFDQHVGTDPSKAVAVYDSLTNVQKAELPKTTMEAADKLKSNLYKQDKIKNAIESGAAAPADHTKLAQLQQDAVALHAELSNPLRDDWSRRAAEDWWLKASGSDPMDFDTKGPTTAFTRERKLPPEADKIMRSWMVNQPLDALSRYFHATSRRVAYVERFGVKSEKLENLLTEALKAGARGEDVISMRGLVEHITGRQKSDLPSVITGVFDRIHAYGTMALLDRATFSSLSEPVSVLMRTGSGRVFMHTMSAYIGNIFRKAKREELQTLARAAALITNPAYDVIMAERTDAHYLNSPHLSRRVTNFYQRIGLTPLTNHQRTSAMVGAHVAMHIWSSDFLNGSKLYQRLAAADLRAHGVPDDKMRGFAEWVVAHPDKVMPSPEEIGTDEGRFWGRVAGRFVNESIQEPLRVDKPRMVSHPIGRLLYGLMSFNYGFFQNVMQKPVERQLRRIGMAYNIQREEGRGRLGAAIVGGVPQTARAATALGAGVAAIYYGSYVNTMIREAIFNPQKWDEHEEKGDLGEYLSDLAWQRSGVNGPLDRLVQLVTGLKYETDVATTLVGPQLGFFLQAGQKMLEGAAGRGSPDTNTSNYNALKGAWNMFAIPAITWGLTAVPGGPIIGPLAGAGLQYLTSPRMADKFATTLAGPKGSGLGGAPPPEKDDADEEDENTTPTAEAGKSIGGGAPIGLLDDLIAPAVKYGAPAVNLLPRKLKFGLGLLAGGAAAKHVVDESAKWKPPE